MLRFQDCSVQQKKLLFSIPELTLEKGQFVALIGANGTGKSTFLSALSGGKTISGSLKFNASDWLGISAKERSKLIALVDNRFQGLEHLSTQEYLELGRFPHTSLLGRLSKNDRELIAKIASELDLNHLLEQATSSLSDGERQRASIARALIQETPIILLDEPTSFLDYPTKRNVMNLIKTIVEDHGKLVLMATHDLELSVEFCSNWLVIDPRIQSLTLLSGSTTIQTLIQKAFPSV